MGIRKFFKRGWKFLHEDSWASLFVTLVLAFVVIKFVFFPLLSFATGTSLPLVIVESCSMYHLDGIEEVLDNPVYDGWGIFLENSFGWDFRNGISKGDVIFVVGVDEVEIGDVIIFVDEDSSSPYPVIHRVVTTEPIGTKGDNNEMQLTRGNNQYRTDETNISKEQIVGKALFKIPFVGWAKLIFFEWSRPIGQRGFCG